VSLSHRPEYVVAMISQDFVSSDRPKGKFLAFHEKMGRKKDDGRKEEKIMLKTPNF